MIRMFRCIALLLVMICGLGDCQAFEGKVRVLLAEGKTVEFDLKNEMVGIYYLQKNPDKLMFALVNLPYEFNENNQPVAITDEPSGTTGAVWYEVPAENIRDISFNGDLVGVKKIAQSDISVSFKENVISLNGVETPVDVIILTLTGNVVLNQKYSSDTVIDLKQFDDGLYVVKTAGQSFKMLVK